MMNVATPLRTASSINRLPGALTRPSPRAPLAGRSQPTAGVASTDDGDVGQGWRVDLNLLKKAVPFTRHLLHAGESIFCAGETFTCLHVIHAGQFKTVNFTADGRGQVVGLHFNGAWLGFDGIAEGRHTCDATALDTAEVWTMRYDDLLLACAREPRLMRAMYAAMSLQISRDCDNLLSLGTLPADARVANFICDWADSLAACDLRTDQIRLHMSRAEIGNYLGMTLETVSRSLRRLADRGAIRFDEKGRRDISIPNLPLLRALIACETNPVSAGTAPARAPALSA